MFCSKRHLVETSCGVTAYTKIISKTNEYNCNEILQIKCNFDEVLNNLLNSPINGFFIITFYGTLSVKLLLTQGIIDGHIMVIEKNKNEYVIHQSFLFVYKHASRIINRQQMIEFIKGLKYINEKSNRVNSEYEKNDIIAIIKSLFWVNCDGVICNQGIEIIFVTPCEKNKIISMFRSLFWVNYNGVIQNKGIEMGFVAPFYAEQLLQNQTDYLQHLQEDLLSDCVIISKIKYLEEIRLVLVNCINSYQY